MPLVHSGAFEETSDLDSANGVLPFLQRVKIRVVGGLLCIEGKLIDIWKGQSFVYIEAIRDSSLSFIFNINIVKSLATSIVAKET